MTYKNYSSMIPRSFTHPSIHDTLTGYPLFFQTRLPGWDLAERTGRGLKKLGATEVIGTLSTDSKALDEERWGGAIDVVGGWEFVGKSFAWPSIALQVAIKE